MAEIPRRKSEVSRAPSSDLNLGFQELLGDPAKEAPKEVASVQASPDAQLKPESTNGDNPLLALALKGEWAELEKRCDDALRGNPSDLEATLWWIRTQLKKGSVPLFVLSSPFDGALKRVLGGEGTSGLKELAKGASQEFADALKERGDSQTLEIFKPHFESLGVTLRSGETKEVPQSSNTFVNPEPWLNKSQTTTSIAPKSGTRDARMAFLFIVFLAAIFFGFRPLLFDSTDALMVASSSPSLDTSQKELKPPTVERVKVGELDALYYGLREGSKGETSSSASEALNLTGANIGNTAPVVSDPPEVSRPQEAVPLRERVDTTGPKEPVARDERRENERPPDIRKDPERGYEVERFRSSRRFEVVVDTPVLPRPSHEARSVSRLRRGDEIVAHERIGYWLKVYSDRGNPGYVLEQDVAPVSKGRRN